MVIEIYMSPADIGRIKELQKVLEVNRIRILKRLLDSETCACQMVEIIGLKHNLLSHHLKVLSDLGYIGSKKHGQHVIYRLLPDRSEEIRAILNLLNT